MIVRTSRLKPILIPVSATPVTGTTPPFTAITSRTQYSPSGRPGGGEASRRIVWRSRGATVRRRGNAWIQRAADGWPESAPAGGSTIRPAESLVGMPCRRSWPSVSVSG